MASSDNEGFTDEQVNFFRLSGLLINEGTSIVRKKFDEKVSSSGKKLAHLLKERENDMEEYRTNRTYNSKRVVKKPRLLMDEQWRLLYDTHSKYAQTSKEFDLTLLTVLFSILLKEKGPNFWSHPPDTKDTSWQADVLRLRYTRNRLYGHVAEMGITLSNLNGLY